jgi:hypothetical protein
MKKLAYLNGDGSAACRMYFLLALTGKHNELLNIFVFA